MKRLIKKIQAPINNLQFLVEHDIRESLKPLVFFDAGKFTREDDGFTIGYHPHSGIGIITYFHGTDLHHRDSGKHHGILHDGSAQWIKAGKGVWHEEGYHRKQNDKSSHPWTGSIHQLWIQLPPEHEEDEIEYAHINKDDLTVVDNVKVLTGNYQGHKGKINTPINMTYLDVSLQNGEEWSFDTPQRQSTGFIFTRDGELQIHEDSLPNNRMAILEHNEGTIKAKADRGTSNFIVVLAEPSQYNIVARGGQIHTNEESLLNSYDHIKEIGRHLLKN